MRQSVTACTVNVYYMQRALKKFKGDLKLWLQHIEFSKQCGHKVSLSKTFGRALAVHPNKPGVFAVWLLMCMKVQV